VDTDGRRAEGACRMLACVGLAALTYRFVERPFLVRKACVRDRVFPAAESRRPVRATA
jgi:hypothetical protein